MINSGEKGKEKLLVSIFEEKDSNILTYLFITYTILDQAVKHVNSVSLIDRTSRVVFPASFFTLNFLYWLFLYYQDHFHWIQQ